MKKTVSKLLSLAAVLTLATTSSEAQNQNNLGADCGGDGFAGTRLGFAAPGSGACHHAPAFYHFARFRWETACHQWRFVWGNAAAARHAGASAGRLHRH